MKLKVLEKFSGSGAAKCMGKYSCLIVAMRTRKINFDAFFSIVLEHFVKKG